MAGGLISSMEQAGERLPGFLAGHENADYPYDAVLVNGAFSDNQGVAAWLPEVVEKWNAEWEYPKLILGRPEDFFRYIEQNFAAKIPVLQADFGGWWEDGAGSSARETALCRRAEERAVTAEMLHSLAAVLAARSLIPKLDFDELWRNILLYDEHTWGAAGSISAPKSEQTVKQWEVKSSLCAPGGRGVAPVARIRHGQAGGTGAGGGPRRVQSALLVAQGIGDNRRRRTPCRTWRQSARSPARRCPKAAVVLSPADLPSVGYRSYRRLFGAAACRETPSRFSGDQMENEFYRVTLDPQDRRAQVHPRQGDRARAGGRQSEYRPGRTHLRQRRRGQLRRPFQSEGPAARRSSPITGRPPPA